ncbi:MAG: selenium-dependent xanthine dehydrogenase [Lachnospiraceae bacterium]|nr:selenium-dependent xanthine dehydrogenase [Lachnospiraceae bacterium]
MIEFKVNGKEYQIPESEDKRLIDFLRLDLQLTATKEGCSAGACGTCTVLVDGKKVKACVQKLSKMAGKEIITVEGIPADEMAVYEYCFGECGAVQCGFCIPGMIISGKSLLDVNLNPTREEVKKAIFGNICRCTGYKAIEDAILMAAEYLREKKPIPGPEEKCGVNQRLRRIDVHDKCTGEGKYVDDIVLPGMCYGKALRSPFPRCLVKKVDVTEALAHPDCVGVLTAKDVPNNVGGHLKVDWPTMIGEGEETRYIGDALAIVVCRTQSKLDEILSLIKLDVEELKPVTCPKEAMAPGAPLIHAECEGNALFHEHVVRGDADAAIKNSKYTVHRDFVVPFTDHAFMEPECAIGEPMGDDGVHVYTASQSVYDELRELTRMLNLPEEKVFIESCYVGGGFGGKEDMSVQHHAALCAYKLKVPVKIKFSRDESIRIHTKRHYMEMSFDVGCDENGILQGAKCLIYADTGAYASLGGPVIQRACTHACGPYNFHNVDIEGTSYYTNNIPAGAYRGFGVTQSNFGFEQCLNYLAEQVGISPWEIRYRNAVKPGDVLTNGQIVTPDCAYRQCLEAVKEAYESEEIAGIAGAFKNSGLGVGVPDWGRCDLYIKDGICHVRTAAACMGQGVGTVVEQIVGEITGLSYDKLYRDQPNTVTTPNSGTSTASRQTLITGEATTRAAKLLKEALDSGKTLEDLEGQNFHGEFLGKTDPMGTPVPNPKSHVGYGYAAQVVALNPDGSLKKVVAAHDVGTVINEQACRGQVDGGVVMSLGYAFTEDFPMVDCLPQRNYAKLGLMRATQVPPIESHLITSPEVLDVALGAKGVGEITSVPTAAACAGAYYAKDHKERNVLPLKETFYNKAQLDEASQSQVGMNAQV